MSTSKFSALFEKFKVPASNTSSHDTDAPDESTSEVSLLDKLELEFEPAPAAPSTPPPLPEMITQQNALSSLHVNTKFWSELSTRLWRTERQLKRLHENAPNEHSERLTRRFEEVLETLREYDVEILDHTGEKYDAGLTLKVLQYEPQDGIAHEVILETVKPSVRLQKVLVPGEVIVATPQPTAIPDLDLEPHETESQVEQESQAEQESQVECESQTETENESNENELNGEKNDES